MNGDLRHRLLGSGPRDPGCDVCFEMLDQYAEAVLRGDDAARLFPEVIAHIAGCAACREDTEGLVAALRRDAPPDEPKTSPVASAHGSGGPGSPGTTRGGCHDLPQNG